MSRNKRNYNLDLTPIKPITENQRKALDSEKNMVLYGVAGSGKTFLSLYKAYNSVMHGNKERVVIIRSAVPTRDMGFLPGKESEKASVYEGPYKDISNQLFNNGTAYEILKSKGMVYFMTTSFVRGITLRDATVIVDECQNMSFHELDSIITRLGDNCSILFCGDFVQTDLKQAKEREGMEQFLSITEKLTKDFESVEFGFEDIVRSGLVKRYIKARESR